MNLNLKDSLHELAVFSSLYEDETFQAFLELIDARMTLKTDWKQNMARFVAKLYDHQSEDWTEVLRDIVLCAPTCLARAAAADHEVPERMLNTAMAELAALSEAAAVTPVDFGVVQNLFWTAHSIDLQGEYLNRLMEIDKYGTGIFASARMFRLSRGNELKIVPVSTPDPVRFENLYGYEEQHQLMIENTKALLQGLPAVNLLLYGDAGTGKSASIKALENELGDQGLRLIEAGKDRLDCLPDLLDQLANEPLKFIVYIDDLSFGENDDSFSALKAVLEGSVSARSSNTVIYATSNRRHLVKESMEARSGDDIHRRDTLQETLSLSQRFGRCVFFEKPNAERYLELVKSIGLEYGLDLDHPLLLREAEAFALGQGGRSARCARQFVERQAALKGMEHA